MDNKLDAITNLFEGKEIRSIWDGKREEYFFSVVDVVSALTDSNDPAHYWRTLKSRMLQEGNETVTNCDTFKLRAKDGKMRNTDMLGTKNILRLIESIPSPKAEPFKMWLASLGDERIDEVFDPEITVNRAVNYYRNRGYNDEWIKKRLVGIVDRFKLTDVWKDGGVEKPIEYAMLTNEIYKGWSGMKASEYKKLKGLRKESLRDNMTDIEVLLTDLGEIATRDIAQSERPQGFNENMDVAKRGGQVAGDARRSYEKQTKKSAISRENALGYKYTDDRKMIEGSV